MTKQPEGSGNNNNESKKCYDKRLYISHYPIEQIIRIKTTKKIRCKETVWSISLIKIKRNYLKEGQQHRTVKKNEGGEEWIE